MVAMDVAAVSTAKNALKEDTLNPYQLQRLCSAADPDL